VSEILAQKGRAVFTAHHDESIEDIAKTLSEKKIGAAVILDSKDGVCGIASERDIVREIAKEGCDALSKPISVCMTQKVISCSENDSIDSLMDKMTKGRFRHLPVIDDGKLNGIISIGDVVKRKIEMAERDAEDMKRYISG
ncbi:MAG: CBS domain-containing protein, partial [Pseudomonadota bacterium]